MKKYLLLLAIPFSLIGFSFSEKISPQDSIVKENTITNLYDAFSKDTTLIKDFGFSCITKYQGRTILFDAGSNADIFKKNTNKLGVDLTKVDIVVISHGHFDHLNGVDYLLQINPKVKIYFPYDVFWGAPSRPHAVRSLLPRISSQPFDPKTCRRHNSPVTNTVAR